MIADSEYCKGVSGKWDHWAEGSISNTFFTIANSWQYCHSIARLTTLKITYNPRIILSAVTNFVKRSQGNVIYKKLRISFLRLQLFG